MYVRSIGSICCLGLLSFLLHAPLRAQDAAQPKGEKDSAKVKSAADQPEAKGEAKPAAESTGARAAFDKKIEEWRSLLKDLRKLKLDFQTAPEAEHQKYRDQWGALITKGHEMMPELRNLALAAYDEAGGADPQLERFLLKFVLDAVEMDDFEVAYDLGLKLVDKGATDKRLIEAVGTSAFCTSHYEEADKYLQMAKSSGVLSDLGNEVLPLISVERELWAKEEEVRKQEAATDDLPLVKLTTTKGEIVLELFENQAPETVGNFVHLVEKGYYDGLTFHRVLQHFVAQGGDPKGDGTGGPGWTIYDEVNREDYRRHFRGSLSMAKTADPNTGGSQFFLTYKQTPNLDGKHTCFGRIKTGMEVLTRLQRMNPDLPQAGAVPDKIVKAEVIRKREHAYVPKKVEQ
jgi:cyclophilin family peptidyl-prolyl cis-trans isomerase